MSVIRRVYCTLELEGLIDTFATTADSAAMLPATHHDDDDIIIIARYTIM